MYELRDTFNDSTISKHRTAFAAGQANRKHQRRVKARNGSSSYIPTVCLRTDGKSLDDTEQHEYRRGNGYID